MIGNDYHKMIIECFTISGKSNGKTRKYVDSCFNKNEEDLEKVMLSHKLRNNIGEDHDLKFQHQQRMPMCGLKVQTK